MLQELLNNGLLDIGTDDSRFEKMLLASEAFVERLTENPELIVPATLIAVETNIEEEDELLDIVEFLVMSEWPTLRQHHANRPREFLRSIIIASLSDLIKDNPIAAGICYNTGISLIRHSQVQSGKAFVLVQRLLNDARDVSEKEALRRASLGPVIIKKKKQKKLEAAPLELELSGNITTAEFLPYIQTAAGPSNEQNTALTDPNPHWSSTAPQWSYTFAPRMAIAVSKAVNTGTARLAASIKKNLGIYLEKIEERLKEDIRQSEQLCAEVAESQSSLRMRLDVLWWTESLYSSSLKVSYSTLDVVDSTITAALDLTRIVPALSPESVTYILGETLYKVSQAQESDKKIPLESYLNLLYEKKLDKYAAIKLTNKNSRQTLLDLIVNSSNGIQPNSKKIQQNSGIDISQELSLREFGMWIFRDIQANRLIKEA